MSDLPNQDMSTLATLQPVLAKELHYLDYKNRLRLQGSQYMLLRRPSRLAESSREYMAGDPVNLIDWKAYARTDQLIIREVRDESATLVRIGLDLSPTMFWPTPEVPVPPLATKAEIAMRLALHLAYVHLRMGDRVELQWVNRDEDSAPETTCRLRRAATVLAMFEKLRASGFTLTAFSQAAELGELRSGATSGTTPGIAPGMTSRIRATERADLVFWLGDGLGRADIDHFLGKASRSFFLHTLSSLELDASWLDDDTSYFDQGLALKEYQGQSLKIRSAYLQQMRSWCEKLHQRQHARGAEYLTVSDKTLVSTFQSAIKVFVKAAGRP
jgi:hypothetical protein